MRKSSSRPRLSQPSGDGSQTVEFFFQRAHFSILGDVSKKPVIKVGEQPTLSHVPSTFLVFFIVTGFSMNVAFVDFFLVCLCVWGLSKTSHAHEHTKTSTRTQHRTHDKGKAARDDHDNAGDRQRLRSRRGCSLGKTA